MVMAAINDMLAPAKVASVRSLQQRKSKDQHKQLKIFLHLWVHHM